MSRSKRLDFWKKYHSGKVQQSYVLNFKFIRKFAQTQEKAYSCFWLKKLVPTYFPVQQLRAALHQLHQREAAAVLQPPHVRCGAGGVPERRDRLDLHRLRHGLASLHRPHRKGQRMLDVIEQDNIIMFLLWAPFLSATIGQIPRNYLSCCCCSSSSSCSPFATFPL